VKMQDHDLERQCGAECLSGVSEGIRLKLGACFLASVFLLPPRENIVDGLAADICPQAHTLG